MKLLTFDEALSDSGRFSKRHILLGNGFSIACRPDIFVYKRLFEQADFGTLSPSAKLAFEALGTQDFEKVIKALRDGVTVLRAYQDVPSVVVKSMADDADALRELLVKTIAASHPERPSDIEDHEYRACRRFLENFNSVYTLNYDLLLYWAQMHTDRGESPVSDDGFRKPEDRFDAAYVTWEPSNSHGQNTWFLHGGLHLFDAGTEIQKYTWVNTGVRLIEQIREALKKNFFPIFVAEGTSDEKYARIRHNDYLGKAYRSFSEIGGSLFVYGHSLAENDEHYLRRIEKGKLRHLCVGLYGDPESASNKAIISRALRMDTPARKQRLEVAFFDASSARVWG